jgi:hypothetical protein
MFERLMLCDYAVADVTGADPNVYYELGIRHALRPRSTLLVFSLGTVLPFDLVAQRGTPYRLEPGGMPSAPEEDARLIAERLKTAHEDSHDDSPLFQLVDGMPRIEIDHAKTDIFRERVTIAAGYRDRLAEARKAGLDAVRAVADDPSLADLRNVEAGVIIDIMLSFRAVGTKEGCAELIRFHGRMPRELQQARMVREQLGFALNRVGRSADAEKVLAEVIREFGASSETNGLLGRVYKDLWEAAKKAGRDLEARGHLRRAIATYRAGFEADWRDPYPGINAVTLMEMQERPDPAQADLLPVVRYAAAQRARDDGKRRGDYWDHATLLELAVLARDPGAAEEAASAALAVMREPWEPATTARNLRLIREARQGRGEDAAWIGEIEAALAAAEAQAQGR